MAINILFLFFFTPALPAQTAFKDHVSFLASDSLRGRAPGTDGEKVAARYIGAYLSRICHAAVRYQQFHYPPDSVNGPVATNIIGTLNKGKRQTILLCAHYDHLGTGSPKALDLLHKNEIHPGADDNASGVAMVMELTRYLSAQKELPFNVIVFFPSAHEAGLYGSEYFASSILSDSINAALIMNFDMVGRLDTLSRVLRVGAWATDTDLMNYFTGHDNGNLHFRLDDSNIDFSDLKYFKPLHIPLLHFTTGIHQDYHRASDTTGKINFEGMDTIYNFLTSFLRYVEMNTKYPPKQSR